MVKGGGVTPPAPSPFYGRLLVLILKDDVNVPSSPRILASQPRQTKIKVYILSEKKTNGWMFAAVCDALYLLLGVKQPRNSTPTAFLIRF